MEDYNVPLRAQVVDDASFPAKYFKSKLLASCD